MTEEIRLDGERLHLRTMTRADLPHVRRWLADNGVTVCRASAAEQNPALENFWLKSGFFRRIAILENNFGGGQR